MKYIKIENEIYTSNTTLEQTSEGWKNAKPLLLSPNLRERMVHYLGWHFSFGQPFCVVCGKRELVSQTKEEKE